MPRFIIAATGAALALALGACGKDDEKKVGRDDGSATVTTTTTKKGNTKTTPRQSSEFVSVGIKNIKFVPAQIVTRVNRRIVWTNKDSVAHNVTATDGAKFESDSLDRNEKFEYTPRKVGTIKYVCTIHPGQNGTITVTK